MAPDQIGGVQFLLEEYTKSFLQSAAELLDFMKTLTPIPCGNAQSRHDESLVGLPGNVGV